jgi:hypothetical protein
MKDQARGLRVALLAALAGAAWAGVVVLTLPPAVNAVAYLAGAGRPATFVATGYDSGCSYGSVSGDTCWSQSTGYLEPGDVPATWPGDVPPGSVLRVRLPVLNWGPGTPLLYNTGLALLAGLTCAVLQLLCWGGLGRAAYQVLRRWTALFR